MAKVQATDMNNLRAMADDLKQKLDSVIIVLGSAQGDKVNLIAGVTKDYIDRGFHAGKLIKVLPLRRRRWRTSRYGPSRRKRP